MSAGIDILNTGAGHTEIRFDNGDPLELERAKRIITDMLRRGYVLFVEMGDKKLSRVQAFDAERGVYIIADLGEPPESPVEVAGVDETGAQVIERRKPGRPRNTEVSMTKVKATAIGRSAGG